MFQKHICSPWCKIQGYLLCRNKTCPKQVDKGLRYIKWTTLGSKEWFDLDLWTCDLKINRDHLLIGRNFCTKFGIEQVKGSKDIEWTIQWTQKSDLILTFEHVTWKSIGIIYSFRATPAPSLVLIKWRGSKDIEWTTQWSQKSGLTLTFEHVTWKTIGIIYSFGATPAPSLVMIKWRGRKILSGQHSGLRRVVWPWPLNMWPENQ